MIDGARRRREAVVVDGLQGLCRRINVGMRGGEWPDDGLCKRLNY